MCRAVPGYPTDENFDLAPRDTTESRRLSPIPLLREAKFIHVIVHRGREILDAENRNQAFETVHEGLAKTEGMESLAGNRNAASQ